MAARFPASGPPVPGAGPGGPGPHAGPGPHVGPGPHGPGPHAGAPGPPQRYAGAPGPGAAPPQSPLPPRPYPTPNFVRYFHITFSVPTINNLT